MKVEVSVGLHIHSLNTEQTFNPSTSQPDVCKCLVVQTPMENIQKLSQAHQWPT